MPRPGASATATMISALLLVACCATGALAQTAGAPDIYTYRGADRDQRLLEKARGEGTLRSTRRWRRPKSAPLAQAFEKKYGIKVQLWRALSENVLQRALTEARGGRRAMDVVETNAPEVEALAREQVVAEFFSPHLADLPAWAKPPHRRWASDRANLWVTGYNTGKVKREELPATLEGFADPKWKGRIALEATDAIGCTASSVTWAKSEGIDFFRKLAALKPEMRKGHVLVAQLVAAGELPVCLTVYSGNANSIKEQGRADRLGWRSSRWSAVRRRWRWRRTRRIRTPRCCSPISCCRRRARSCWPTWVAYRRAARRRRCSTGTST